MGELDLQDLVQSLRALGSDHSTCEVKKAKGGIPNELWESVSGFSNADGGTIVLGIDEKNNFEIAGVDDSVKMEAQVASVCEEMEPPVRATIQTQTFDGKNVVVAIIPKLPRNRRPCYKRSEGPVKGTRMRVSDGNRKLSDYEVFLLLQNREEQKQDLRPIRNATIDNLDEQSLEGFLRRVRETRSPSFSRMPDEQVLTTLNVMVRLEDGQLVPTLAGLLSFGIYPQQFEPQLDITFISYPTTIAGELGSGGERFLENRSIDGSIPNMVSECIKILKRNMRRRSIVSGLFRTDLWEYPEEVLREALVNALVHRDYSEASRGTQIQVEMYPDRLVVRNPGGLYGPVDVASLGTSKTSSSRNGFLLKILEDTPLGDGHMVCENRGSGIVRMRLVMSEAGMEPPEFRDDIATFEAEFPNHTLLDEEVLGWLGSLRAGPLSRSQMTALAIMRQGHSLTNSAFRQATGVSDSRLATRELKDLVERGLIVQSGSRGTSAYRLAGSAVPDELEVPDYTPVSIRVEAEPLPEMQSRVYAALSLQPAPLSTVAAVTGLEPAQVYTALNELQKKNLVALVGKPKSRNAMWVRRVP